MRSERKIERRTVVKLCILGLLIALFLTGYFYFYPPMFNIKRHLANPDKIQSVIIFCTVEENGIWLEQEDDIQKFCSLITGMKFRNTRERIIIDNEAYKVTIFTSSEELIYTSFPKGRLFRPMKKKVLSKYYMIRDVDLKKLDEFFQKHYHEKKT